MFCAHILWEALERHYGGCLCYGPPIDNGFYYDFLHQVLPHELEQLETLFKAIVKDEQPFVRLEMKREDLLEMFKVVRIIIFIVKDILFTLYNTQYNKFKCQIINQQVTTPTTTVYR